MPKSQEYGMPDSRYRVLAVAAHPVQYMAPIFRRMATHTALDLQVAYCTLRGAEAGDDPEFGGVSSKSFSSSRHQELHPTSAYQQE